MLGIATVVTLFLGGAWMAEAFLGLRFEGIEMLYPFAPATRQIAGVALFAVGGVLAWAESRQITRALHS